MEFARRMAHTLADFPGDHTWPTVAHLEERLRRMAHTAAEFGERQTRLERRGPQATISADRWRYGARTVSSAPNFPNAPKMR